MKKKLKKRCSNCHHWDIIYFFDKIGYCPVFNKNAKYDDGTKCKKWQECYYE